MSRPVLEVENLRVELGYSHADIVDEISFHIMSGEVLGLVGESGSGKSTIGLALLGHQRRGAGVAGGEVRLEGDNILKWSPGRLRKLRGGVVSYVPQDPSASLNPALRIGKQLEETLEAHAFGGSSKARHDRIDEMMGEVLLPTDRDFLQRYPHQLSGGQLQRVALAMAFACRPKVIVLDEPTTALDVTTQHHVRSGCALRDPRPRCGCCGGGSCGRDVRRTHGRARTQGATVQSGCPSLHEEAHSGRARHLGAL